MRDPGLAIVAMLDLGRQVAKWRARAEQAEAERDRRYPYEVVRLLQAERDRLRATLEEVRRCVAPRCQHCVTRIREALEPQP